MLFNTHGIPYGKGDLGGEEPHHQWYCPEIANCTYQSSNSNPNPITQVTWSYDTIPPAFRRRTTASKPREFNFSMDLAYRDRMGNSVVVVYEGARDDSLKHTG